jgi:hypothetical protein
MSHGMDPLAQSHCYVPLALSPSSTRRRMASGRDGFGGGFPLIQPSITASSSGGIRTRTGTASTLWSGCRDRWATSETATTAHGKTFRRIAHEAPAPNGQKAKPAAAGVSQQATETIDDGAARFTPGWPFLWLVPAHECHGRGRRGAGLRSLRHRAAYGARYASTA